MIDLPDTVVDLPDTTVDLLNISFSKVIRNICPTSPCPNDHGLTNVRAMVKTLNSFAFDNLNKQACWAGCRC